MMDNKWAIKFSKFTYIVRLMVFIKKKAFNGLKLQHCKDLLVFRCFTQSRENLHAFV